MLELSPVNILIHLKEVLKVNAKKLIDGFNLEDTSYDSAVKLSKSTFDKLETKKNHLIIDQCH